MIFNFIVIYENTYLKCFSYKFKFEINNFKNAPACTKIFKSLL